MRKEDLLRPAATGLQQQAWQRTLLIANEIKSVCAIENAAFRSQKLQHLHEGFDIVLEPVKDWPTTTKATCEELVQKMKVPKKITEMCCSALEKESSISNILVDLLSTFLETMLLNGAHSKNGEPSELAAVIEKQFQQAGLYKHLTHVFTYITVQLAAAKATPVQLLPMQDNPTEEAIKQQEALNQVLLAAKQALTMYYIVSALLPLESTPAAWDPSIDAAALSLALTIVQQASKWMDALPANGPEPEREMRGLLQDACIAVVRCAANRANDQGALHSPRLGQMPRYTQLLISPKYLAALCLAFFYHTHNLPEEAEGSDTPAAVAAAGRAGSSGGSKASSSNASSSSKGSSKKGSGGSSTAASTASSSQQQQGVAGSSSSGMWAMACTRAQQLPPLQQELLQAIKCSGKVLLWAAVGPPDTVGGITMSKLEPGTAVCGLIGAYKQIVQANGHLARVGGLDEAERQAGTMHTLLPGLLLPWAIAQPGTDKHQLVMRCLFAGDLSCSACKAVFQRFYQPNASMLAAMGMPIQMPGQQPRQVASDQAMFATKLKNVLPDLNLVLERLLETARKSSSSGSSSRRGQDTYEDDLAQALWYLTANYTMLAEPVKHVQVVEPFTWYPQPGQIGVQPTASAGSAAEQHPWQPHAAQVMALLESFVRLPQAAKGSDGDTQNLPFAMLTLLFAVGDRAQPAALTATAIAAGPGSTDQQRLFCLVLSTVKRSGMLGPTQQTDAEECRLIAGCVAARLAQLHASSSSAFVAAGSASASSCVAELLSWLVLFGRCCLQWAVQLQWRHKGILGLPSAATIQPYLAEVSLGSVMGRMDINNSSDVFFRSAGNVQNAGARPLMSLFLAALQSPLRAAGTSAQLAAMGLNAEALLTKVSSAKAAVDAGRADQPDAVISAVKDLGQALTSLPCGSACNNPSCTNMSEASEAQLVQGSHYKCSACRTARYCGKECQAKHWKQHKPVCKALAAAGAAAAGSGEGNAASGAPVSA